MKKLLLFAACAVSTVSFAQFEEGFESFNAGDYICVESDLFEVWPAPGAAAGSEWDSQVVDSVAHEGLNSLLIFTKTNFLFVSCVAEPNPCTVFFPIRSLNVIPSDISKYANLVGALLARTFFLLGIDMWKSQFQHSGWRSPFATRCKIYVVYVRLSFMTCINKC